MPRLEWDLPRERTYDAGVDRGVLYIPSLSPVVWPGLISVEEVYTNQDKTNEYLDGRKVKTSIYRPEFQAKISSFAPPKHFALCDGYLKLAPGFYATNQRRVPFSFSYRTRQGSATEGLDYNYRIHLVYNALCVLIYFKTKIALM